MISCSHWGMFAVGYWIPEHNMTGGGTCRAIYIHPTDDRYDSKYLHG